MLLIMRYWLTALLADILTSWKITSGFCILQAGHACVYLYAHMFQLDGECWGHVRIRVIFGVNGYTGNGRVFIFGAVFVIHFTYLVEGISLSLRGTIFLLIKPIVNFTLKQSGGMERDFLIVLLCFSSLY